MEHKMNDFTINAKNLQYIFGRAHSPTTTFLGYHNMAYKILFIRDEKMHMFFGEINTMLISGISEPRMANIYRP